MDTTIKPDRYAKPKVFAEETRPVPPPKTVRIFSDTGTAWFYYTREDAEQLWQDLGRTLGHGTKGKR